MIRRTLAAGIAALLALSACSSGDDEAPPPPDLPPGQEAAPPEDLPAADEAAATLATALGELDIAQIPMQSTAATAQEELELLFAGMDGIHPSFAVDTVGYLPEERAAVVGFDVTVEASEHPWEYETEATLKWVDDAWRLEWRPSVVHPKLSSETRLRRTETAPRRAAINDHEGLAIVEEVTLYQVGLDKGAAKQSVWDEAARHLAGILEIDEDDYAAKVLAGGDRQFVVAKTMRQEEIPAEVTEVPGLYVRETTSSQGPYAGFAGSLLGIVGHPTAEMIEKSDGELSATDMIGLSGLQSRYDERLRGVAGVTVEVVPRKGVEDVAEVVVYQQDQSVGTPLETSLDRDLQEKAETILEGQEGIAALVAIDVASGGIRAAAQSEAAGTYPHATFGKYAPGSTFKVASALAMVRDGKTAQSTVECTPSHEVAGHTFRNYPGYGHTGTIPLADAIAYSCNTAFTRASSSISGEQLHAAASSLGVGTDYDAGFSSYFGTVEPGNEIDLAASMIGQGQVTMSPMGMAAVAASVAKGATVIPWLVAGEEAESTADPLTEAEAAELRTMLEATVDHGTGTSLKGVAKGAKSGTAEWGPSGNQQTHAWMIAYTDSLAVAAFVEVGDSGGTVAAPLIKQLLS